MIKRFVNIVFAIVLCLQIQAEAIVMPEVPCGSWITIEAHPFPNYAFVEWSDGNTEPVRQVQVNEDATYIAYFSDLCEEYANWPVVALYDWLLMVNVTAILQMGYYVSPANVTWYHVVGEPDDMHGAFPQDDQVVARHSYYLTLAKNLQGSGSYYAVVDVSNSQGQLCNGLMRTVIVNYNGTSNAPQLRLSPNYAFPGQEIQLTGLNPDETTTVQIFSTAGQLIRTFTCEEEKLFFPAERTSGCYHVRVTSPSVNQVIKYLVKY